MSTDFRAELQRLVKAIKNWDFDTGSLEQDWSALDRAEAALAHPEPTAPSNKEVAELVARLRDWHSVPLLSQLTRAADLLERLASDNAGLAAAADSLYADNMSLLDNHHE